MGVDQVPRKRLSSPKTLRDFVAMFPGEDACVRYLSRLRWPDGKPCPNRCESEFASYRGGRVIFCRSCRRKVSLTAGTIMHRSHTDLLTWFYGAFFVTTLTPGISAVQFQKQLGIKRYETAFQLLHKLRAAMLNPEREPLRGVVEVDETYVGGHESGRSGGRGMLGKTLVIGAVELRPTSDPRRAVVAGRVRFRVAEAATSPVLTRFVEDHIESGSTVVTDSWQAYLRLESRGYKHVARLVGHKTNASQVLPLIHLEFANLKTWLRGTHHSRVERRHLQAYLNEFAFRHNRRFWRFSAFQTVLRLGLKQRPQEYQALYGADEFGKNVHSGAFRPRA